VAQVNKYNDVGRMKEKLRLFITHVPTGYSVSFPAYLEMFSDAYTSQWNAEDVYGRMDPIATFTNTRRALSLAWNVPASDYEEAQSNVAKVNKLFSFLYPLYENESVGGATAINQSPLLRISFGNLIRNAKNGKGLLGYVNGFTFDPALEFGMFYAHSDAQEREGDVFDENILPNSKPGVQYYPKTFRLNCEFNVLHEHSLGFKRADGTGKSFIYNDPNIKSEQGNQLSFPYYTPRPDQDYVLNAIDKKHSSKLKSETSFLDDLKDQVNTEDEQRAEALAQKKAAKEAREAAINRTPYTSAVDDGLPGEKY